MEQLRQFVGSLFTSNEDEFNEDEDYPPWDERATWKVVTVEEAATYVRPRLFPDFPVSSRTSAITGAHIPPEIFPSILFFVSVDDQSKRVRQKVKSEKWRNHFAISAIILAQPAYTLKSCSLVSVYWANQCRRYMFLDHLVRLRSYEDAAAFRHYSTLPNSRLTPICDLVRVVHVNQVRPDSRSLLHLICLPSTQHKLSDYNLQGPISSKDPTPALSTSHYSLPHRMAMPPSITSYRKVTLVSLDFSSFHDVVSYIRNFRDAERLQFHSLTWSNTASTSLLHMVQPFSQRHPRHKIHIQVDKCTDNYLLCYQTMVLFPDSPLRMIPVQDQHVVENIMRGFYTHLASLTQMKPDQGQRDTETITHSSHARPASPRDNGKIPSCSMDHDASHVDQLRFRMSSFLQGYTGINVQFVCQQSSQPEACRDHSPNPFRPTGIMVSIQPAAKPVSAEDEFITADLTALRMQLADLCAIHTIVFTFHGYPTMRGVLDHHPTLCEPLVGKERYLFVCERMSGMRRDEASVLGLWDRDEMFGGPRWVGVDPITLEATGVFPCSRKYMLLTLCSSVDRDGVEK
ncbi:hypothetical protein BDW22DRAFT_3505 [Trametopsis cervina]|nr:hypothetical protein BDW22DRAFT_3505 [Trametopsis cervina]